MPITYILQGHDTVSAATSYAVYLIGLYPEIQKRCVDELHEIFGKWNIPPFMLSFGVSLVYVEHMKLL